MISLLINREAMFRVTALFIAYEIALGLDMEAVPRNHDKTRNF